MAEVWTMGEMIVEIMREEVGVSLKESGRFLGPFPSGAPAIFIDTIARLGRSAGIVGAVGNDDFGNCLLERLNHDGVDCSKVGVSEDGATGVAFVTYFDDGSRQFIFHLGRTPAVEAKVPNEEDLRGIKFFHIMGCSLMADSEFAREIVKTMHLAMKLGAKVSFDPNIRKELLGDKSVFSVVQEVFANTSVFMPGAEELLLLTGKDSIDSAVESCFENQRIEIIVLKKGSSGCSVHTRSTVHEFGVYPVDVVDPTGAGDSFDGAFICGLLDGLPIPEIIKFATAAASLNTAAFGPMEGAISVENVMLLIHNGGDIGINPRG